MRGLPFLPWFGSDWLASSARVDMTLPARAVYLDLLFQIWERGGALPTDALKLAKLAMTTPEEFQSVWPELQSHFAPHPEEPNAITNLKMYDLMQKQIKEHETNVLKGRAGGIKSGIARRNRLRGVEKTCDEPG